MRLRAILFAAALAAIIGGGDGSAAGAGPSTISSCTTEGLQAAVAAGGDWVFACSGTIQTKDPPPPSGSPADTELQQPFALAANEALTLDANGHAVTIDGDSSSRLFTVPPGAVLRLRGVSLSDGAIRGDGTLRHRFGGFAGAIGADGGPGANGSAGSGAGSP